MQIIHTIKSTSIANMSTKAVIHDADNKEWLLFEDPVKIVQTDKLSMVLKEFDSLQKQCFQDNYYAVGFISYDASPAFDYAFEVRHNGVINMPLLWFALFKNNRKIQIPTPTKIASTYFDSWRQSVSKAEYRKAIGDIKKHIQAGDSYQVNYTFRQYAKFSGNYWNFFCELVQGQYSQYSAFLESDDFVICSVSPELFFTYDKGRVVAKPMKGTVPRGFTYLHDLEKTKWLYLSEKNRAENIMIVDMIRNDLGKISEPGMVKVSSLFDIEKYSNVWQMTSTVSSYTNKPLSAVMQALFPCASITGAPKSYTMKIISKTETTARNLYTGTIGFIKPTKKAQFNVAIRTTVIEKSTNVAEYGVGGGIVWDSSCNNEYDECLLKTKFIFEKFPIFSILESILWEPRKGYFLLDYHLNRMEQSAIYFDYKFNRGKIVSKLEELCISLKRVSHKIRIMLEKNGKITFELNTLGRTSEFLRGIISDKPISVDSPFIYHKTTNRANYDKFKKKFPGYDEVILWNRSNEVTEGLFSNLVIKIKNNFFTPPVSSGLLAGTFRQYLIDKGKINEKIIKCKELLIADEIYIINSVRKWQRLVI